MKKEWQKPEVNNLAVEETAAGLHYHCVQCGRAVTANEINNAPVVDDMTMWECPSCGGRAYGSGCYKDDEVSAS